MRWRYALGWLGLAAGMMAGGLWWASGAGRIPPNPPAGIPSQTAEQAAPTVAAARPHATQARRSDLQLERSLTSPEPSASVPPGVAASTWQALRTELAGRPDGEAELQRLAAYYAWTDAWARWRQARAGGASVAALAPLTAAVEAGLADRLAAREVGAAEAWQIMAALREADSPDAAARQLALQAWADGRPGGAFGPGTVDPRMAGFATAQAATVAAWQAEPGHDRAVLQRRLTALRDAHFASDATPAAGR